MILCDTKIDDIKDDFKNMFNAIIYMNFILLKFLYRPCNSTKEYELFFLTEDELKELMLQSMKEGKDLVFEKCKHYPFDTEKRLREAGFEDFCNEVKNNH